MLSLMFRSPRRRAGPFSLHAQRKGTKRKGTLASRSPDILSVDCASRLRGSLTAHPVPTTNARASMHAPLRAFSSTRSPGRKGTREERTRAPARAKRVAACMLACLALLRLCSAPQTPLGGRRAAAEMARRVGAMDRAHCAVSAGTHCRRNRPTCADPRGFFPRAGAVGCPSLW